MKRPWHDMVALWEEYYQLTGQFPNLERDQDFDRRPGESTDCYCRRLSLIGTIRRLIADHDRRFKQHCKFQAAFTRLRQAHPTWSRHYVATLVATKFQVSAKTVLRNTYDPAPVKK